MLNIFWGFHLILIHGNMSDKTENRSISFFKLVTPSEEAAILINLGGNDLVCQPTSPCPCCSLNIWIYWHYSESTVNFSSYVALMCNTQHSLQAWDNMVSNQNDIYFSHIKLIAIPCYPLIWFILLVLCAFQGWMTLRSQNMPKNTNYQ